MDLTNHMIKSAVERISPLSLVGAAVASPYAIVDPRQPRDQRERERDCAPDITN